MLDSDLQLRFFKNLNEACFAWASASVAASMAWQQQVFDAFSGAQGGRRTYAAPAGFPAWGPFNWMAAAPAAHSAADFGSAFFQFAPAMKNWPGMQWWGMGDPWRGFGAMTAPADPFAAADMMKAFWAMPQMPWTMYQMPWAAVLISNGVPASVANPAVRASTATLEAAEAAKQQVSRLFSAYRSDGGHASTHIFQFLAMLIFALLASAIPLWQAIGMLSA